MKYSIILIAILGLSGCAYKQDADDVAQAAQQKTLLEGTAQVGMPNIKNFSEKRFAKRLYELRDRTDLMTYTYTVGVDGVPHFLCRSVGYGVPYAAQFSNPEKYIGEGHTMPQAEPNGLFMPATAEGTWILALDKDGTTHVLYVEPRVIVSEFELPKSP